ncbi:hypothetical protein [Gottfriedia sp. OAE603]|uniref:hypothetical protein n=1 Tax=Gottfriedia sp. OAE603 TaxID=2663872 RepID=UPI0019F65452
MKKTTIYILITLLFSVLLIKSFISLITERNYMEDIESTNLSDEKIDNVRIHDDINGESFVKKFGKPLERDDNDEFDYYHWSNGFVTASIIKGDNKGKIVRLIIGSINEQQNTPQLQTSRGIKLGDSMKDIISVYGEHYYNRVEQGCNIIGYVDKNNRLILEFWMGDQVQEIRLDERSIY